MAEYIAASTTASDGSDFTVSTSAGVSCYGYDGAEVVGKVEKKNSDGTYSALTSRINPDKSPVAVMLTGNQDAFTITKPGDYRIVKYTTEGTAGIDIEVS